MHANGLCRDIFRSLNGTTRRSLVAQHQHTGTVGGTDGFEGLAKIVADVEAERELALY